MEKFKFRAKDNLSAHVSISLSGLIKVKLTTHSGEYLDSFYSNELEEIQGYLNGHLKTCDVSKVLNKIKSNDNIQN